MFIVAQSWVDTEMSFMGLVDGWGYMLSYMQGNPEIEGSSYFPPNTSASFATADFCLLHTVDNAKCPPTLSSCIANRSRLLNDCRIYATTVQQLRGRVGEDRCTVAPPWPFARCCEHRC